MSDILGDRNLQDLSQNKAELRIWLPEEIKKALNEIIMGQRMTAAKYIREFFVLYLYGMHELLKMQQKHDGLYYTPRQSRDAVSPSKIQASVTPGHQVLSSFPVLERISSPSRYLSRNG